MRVACQQDKEILFPFKDKARVQIGMNPGTLNRARMLEYRVQHLTKMRKHMFEHWFQQHRQGYLF